MEGSPTMVPVGTTMLRHTAEGLETGIKVVDLFAPCAHGGKIGLFGGAGAGETVDSGTHQQHCQSPWRLLYFLQFVSFKPLFCDSEPLIPGVGGWTCEGYNLYHKTIH